MMNDFYISEFLNYLAIDLNYSENTINSYNNNITKFNNFIGNKDILKITVKDISEKCGINRNTFYYHYQDTFTLLEEIFELDFDQIVEQYPKLNSLEECLDAITLNAKEKKHAIMHVYRSDRKNIYVDVLWKMCEYVTKKYLSTVFPDVQLSDYDRQLITRYFKCSCFGLTIDWIKAGMKDEYVEDMHRILQQSKGVADLIIKNCIESQQ